MLKENAFKSEDLNREVRLTDEDLKSYFPPKFKRDQERHRGEAMHVSWQT